MIEYLKSKMKLLSIVANFDMEIKLHKASIYFRSRQASIPSFINTNERQN